MCSGRIAPWHRYAACTFAFATCALAAGTFRVADTRVMAEDAEFSVRVSMTHDDAVSAATVILRADPAVFTIVDALVDANAAAPEWHLATVEAAWTACSWILDYDPPHDGRTLAGGTDQEIARFVCRLRSGLAPCATALVLPAEPQGTPPLRNTYVVDDADAFPQLIQGTLTITSLAIDSIAVLRHEGAVTLTVAGEGFAADCAVWIDAVLTPFTYAPDGTLVISGYACAGAAPKVLRVCRGVYCDEKPFACGTSFLRGDANVDGAVDIGDAVRVLAHLFGGATLRCRDAADANDDGALDIADAVYVLAYLFARGKPPPEPFGALGSDPTADAIECGAYDVGDR